LVRRSRKKASIDRIGYEQDPEKPGHHVVSFKPSDNLRDDLVHTVEVKMKKGRLHFSTKFPIPIRKLTLGSRPQAERLWDPDFAVVPASV
jgi:hypothetical protein